MATKRPTQKFWVVLITVNVLAMIYPISLVLVAESDYARFLGTLALVVIVFLLAITDTISILMGYEF